MNMDLRDFADFDLWDERATHGPAPHAARHAALRVLAGMRLSRPRPCLARPSQRLGLLALSKGAQALLEPQRSPWPGTPITARAGAFNCRF
ncbi:MAG: hypothetical protein LBV61_00015 [Burkholderiaceae bacterium]|jgi:hypothetical protein|nr:hypothetical protein [Burkholderiaceae bacterium]